MSANITNSDAALTAIAARLVDERVADIIEVLNDYATKQAAEIIANLPIELAIETLDFAGLEKASKIVEALPKDLVAKLLNSVSADRVADMLRHMAPSVRDDTLSLLDSQTSKTMKELLAYPAASVGSIMTTEFVSVPATWTVGETLKHICMVEGSRESVYSIFVVEPETQRMLIALPLRRLISADPDTPILQVVPKRRAITVSALADRDEAARLISKYDLLAVPVLNDAGQVIGLVTVDDVIDDMVERQTEEVQRFGGVEALNRPYMAMGFLGMIKKRAGWLCALFLSEMLTASAMQAFEDELEKAVVLTLFIPLIMSSGGNSGSQATSLLIRALALEEIKLGDWWRVALRELPTGVALGAILGAIGAIRITIWQLVGFYDYGPHWMLIATTVAAALVGIVTFGSLAGSMLPFLLQRLRFDPATASAPFVATLVDVTGLVIYFSVALVILHGTLL